MAFSLFKKRQDENPPERSGKIGVLFVCTGNICRSPTAEGVLRHRLEAEGLTEQVAVDSAGLIDYHVGSPPDLQAIIQAEQRGYNLNDLRSRRFQRQDYREFDLIVCMDRNHHTQLLTRCPDGYANRLRLFMEFAPEGSGGADVPDPYDGDIEDFDHVLDLIEPGVDGLIAELRRNHL